jgi:hypothetical protein
VNLMKAVSAALIAALLLAAAPVAVWAGDDTHATPGVRASVDRAVAKALANHQPDTTARTVLRRANGAGESGGGPGKVMAVVAILGTVGGLAATYFVVKQMRKQSNTGQ